jgi:hypothetical protein
MEARYLPEATPAEELGTQRADVVEPGVPEPAPEFPAELPVGREGLDVWLRSE